MLGFLVRELGLGQLVRLEFSLEDVLLVAVLSAIGSAFARLLRAIWIADAALLLLLCLVALTPVMSALTSRWIRADALPNDALDAVVVLSSSVTTSGTLHVSGSDRLQAGLELIRRGVAPRLVTTRVTDRGGSVNSDADQRRLIALSGVTDRWTLIGDAVKSTRDEAVAVDRLLRELGPRRIAVVTSPLHTRRACATFEKVGMRVTCVRALERDEQTGAPRSDDDRLAAFRAYLYERIAWWFYRGRGWLNAG